MVTGSEETDLGSVIPGRGIFTVDMRNHWARATSGGRMTDRVENRTGWLQRFNNARWRVLFWRVFFVVLDHVGQFGRCQR